MLRFLALRTQPGASVEPLSSYAQLLKIKMRAGPATPGTAMTTPATPFRTGLHTLYQRKQPRFEDYRKRPTFTDILHARYFFEKIERCLEPVRAPRRAGVELGSGGVAP